MLTEKMLSTAPLNIAVDFEHEDLRPRQVGLNAARRVVGVVAMPPGVLSRISGLSC